MCAIQNILARSVIFFQNEEQEKIAKKSKSLQQSSGRFSNGIVTEISPVSDYYLAEDYHQQYLDKQRQPYRTSMLLMMLAGLGIFYYVLDKIEL